MPVGGCIAGGRKYFLMYKGGGAEDGLATEN